MRHAIATTSTAVAVAVAVLVSGTALAAPPCTTQATLGFAALKLVGSGCITTSGTRQTTPAGAVVLVNGLELHPAAGGTLALDSSTGTLTSGGGAVTIDVGVAALGQKQVTFKAQPISWRVVANPGEKSIDEGSFSGAGAAVLLSLPVLSNIGIRLETGQSDTNFTVGVPLPPGVAAFFGVLKATATVLSNNTAGARFDGLDATIGLTTKPEISKTKVVAPLVALYGHLQFRVSTNTWNVALIFTVPGAGGISAETQVVNGKPTKIEFTASYTAPGLALGNTGAFLQEISGSFVHYPRYTRPKIGLIDTKGTAPELAARAAECKDIDTYYDQYIARNQAFPKYCGKVGEISFDPPLEVNGGVGVTAGPAFGKGSVLRVDGSFRYVDSYFDGFNKVPWAFNVTGAVSVGGITFDRPTLDLSKNKESKFSPINNAGAKAWLEVHGDGLIQAGGGFDAKFPNLSDVWLLQINGQVALSLIPKGAAIGAPPAGASPQDYAKVVQGRANSWTIAGTITGQLCAQIPKVAKGCATGAAGISNNGVAGCASFSLPGTTVVQAIAVGGAQAINTIARFGKGVGDQLRPVFNTLGKTAVGAAKETKQFFEKIGSTVSSGATKVVNTIGAGLKSAGNSIAKFFGFGRDEPLAGGAANEVINENIRIPDVNFSIGAVYRWREKTTTPISDCSHAALLQALSARDLARASAAGLAATQVIVRSETIAPRMFEITGVRSAPDVLVMGPDDRAIRTMGPGFIEPGWIVYKDPALKTTYVDVVAARPGRWDFVAAPGTSPIARIATAAGVSIPTVSAGITGARARGFIVSYRVRGAAPGDSVALVETSGSGTTVPIARLRGGAGAIRYVPSPTLPSLQRVILAIVTHGGAEVSVQPVTGINLSQVAAS